MVSWKGRKSVMEEVPLRPLSSFQQGVISLALISMGAGFSISFLVISPLAREAGLTEIEVAIVLVGSSLLYTVLTPTWAKLAERFGRKRVMVFSMFASAGTNALFIFALNAALTAVVTGAAAFWLLIVVRMSFGILSPGLHPASMAAMADATTAKTRAAGMGLMGASMALGQIIGPAGISVLAPFGAMAPIWGSVVFSALCAVFTGFALPPTRKVRNQAERANRPPPLKLRDPRIRTFILALLFYFVAVAAIQQAIVWLVQDRFDYGKEVAIQRASLIYVSLSITMVGTQFGIIQRFKPDPNKILFPGLLLIATGYLITAFAPFLWMMCAGFLVVGIGAALAIAALNALGSMTVPIEEQGQAASLLAIAPPAGYIAGPLLGAALYMIYPPLPLFMSAAMMAMLAIWSFARFKRGDTSIVD